MSLHTKLHHIAGTFTLTMSTAECAWACFVRDVVDVEIDDITYIGDAFNKSLFAELCVWALRHDEEVDVNR